ncbi:Uncharacterized conserved protein, DUF305 family [Nocardioides scoriae]|uniref:Uncharacterized conserved protein, DUF305 family n=1 Tax=Nocardioides scoriae TaxID=642780 RepID=A0A1H1W7Q9_9ACTN|nr:DUF305 domain-containing protein [Nocardioides scoriae]SDS92701.1 Uncharacterized conserved protein, DUF305 family [Nocardioides scoriae]
MHKLALATASLLLLAGCGTSTGSTTSGSDHNQADVAFAQQMIPHHAQAVQMAEMALDRTSDPALERLAQEVEDAQDPEIETMTGWLEDWDAEVPSTRGTMSGSGDGGTTSGDPSSGGSMAGMMSGADMRRLDDATGSGFDRMWLQMMVQHHEGAVEMAKAEQADGENRAAKRLAASIEESQTGEIARMQEMLG